MSEVLKLAKLFLMTPAAHATREQSFCTEKQLCHAPCPLCEEKTNKPNMAEVSKEFIGNNEARLRNCRKILEEKIISIIINGITKAEILCK